MQWFLEVELLGLSHYSDPCGLSAQLKGSLAAWDSPGPKGVRNALSQPKPGDGSKLPETYQVWGPSCGMVALLCALTL